ncbi:hypothetical protein J7T55_003695 [Diaporthe amygdali]|uniref:uncharacterized protein n=1 Tax=Phomopsis amygdali TaxID=1214568 RepID=UPI0022FEE47D|nr:uncharacterized protein J7T55_003695 [Diaporthe amygdali]KAJ0117284.1 hypothetical protein J7T55_003695 [Diaporthe amygdali]
MDDDLDYVSRRRQRPPRSAIAALLGLLLLVNLAASLYQLPLNRVVERRLCQEYYSYHDPSIIGPGGDIEETFCKADPVQAGLGRIQGFMDTAWIVGDFVMTIPLGFVAERYGRRALLWLNLVPRVFMLAWAVIVGNFDQVLPTKAILAGPTLSFLGGDCVFNSITYSLAAGITDDYVLRASYFGYMSSISYVVNLLGPALASASMTLLLWLPFWIGITLLIMAIPVISMLPDHNTAFDGRDEQSQPLLSSPLLKAQDSGPSFLHSVIDRFHVLRAALASHPRNFSLLLACFLLASLASSDTKLLVQYISKRYQWTFASAGYLLSGKAVVNFVLLTIVVPRVLRSVAGKGSPNASDHINFRFANLCFGVSVLGALAIAVSAAIWLLVPALLVYALGSALPIFTLSLLKSPAICSSSANNQTDEDQQSPSPGADAETHIFSIVMLVKTLGSLLGAPLMAFLWVRGIGLGGAALGMPYFVSAGCYAVAIFIFCRIRIV